MITEFSFQPMQLAFSWFHYRMHAKMYHLKSVCMPLRNIYSKLNVGIYPPRCTRAQRRRCWAYWARATWQRKNKVHKFHLQRMEPNKVKKNIILTGAKLLISSKAVKINKRIHLYSYINRRPDRPRTTQSCLRPRRPNKHVWKKNTRVKTAYKASRLNSNVKKNWTFYCNHTCAAAVVHSTFQL